MKTAILLFFLLNIFLNSVSGKSINLYTPAEPGNSVTISINIKNLDEEKVSKLKDNLISFEEKVLAVKYDPKKCSLDITYNEYFKEYEFRESFYLADLQYPKKSD